MSSDFWGSSPFLFRLYQIVGSPLAAAHCKVGTGGWTTHAGSYTVSSWLRKGETAMPICVLSN